MTNQFVRQYKLVQFTYRVTNDQDRVVLQIDLPVQYIHGASNMGLIDVVEKAMEGAQVGETIEVLVSPEDGFGDHDPSLVFVDDIENVPPQYQQIGAKVAMESESGESKEFIVTKIEDGKLTVDGNHPLAGTVNFFVTIKSIRDATADEIMNGVENEMVSIE